MMREMLVAGAVMFAATVQPACARQQTPEELYRTGRYDEAVAALRSANDAASRRLLVRTLLEVGRYEDAERAALNGMTPETVPVALANALGEAMYARGNRTEAEALFARAAASSAPDALRARLNAGIAKWERGAHQDAYNDFDTFIDIYNSRSARTAPDLTAVATAVSYLGLRDPQLFQDAVRAYEEAAAADPRYVEPKIREAELFLARYNSTDASALFREALSVNPRHPEALLGLARAMAFDGTDQALALVDSSLAVNGASPSARAFRARLLLGVEDYDGARREVELALEANPASLEALAMLGAVHFLRDDRRAHDAARSRALALNPAYAEFDVTVAEMAIQHRRYTEAVDIARQGSAVNASSWNAHAVIGLTELRLGNVTGARRSLETAFGGDPYNVWVKNTLDLLDTYRNYVTRTSPRFELFLHVDEADLVELYMTDLAEEAYETMARRYDARPEPPIRVEVYPRHADFSVRTVGLAGLGALGVAFGNILAMDSPAAARDAGPFNWGSTLWHEIGHAVTLTASNHRVPRWLTEGISVLEERRARPGWGEGVTLDFLVALKTGRLLPVSELNAGFVRPQYPEQVMHAYYQASLVAEYIEQAYGARALRDMLRAYRDGRSNDEVVRQVLRVEPAALDAAFDRAIRERFATQLGAIEVPTRVSFERGAVEVDGAFVTALRAARTALAAGHIADAKEHAERARDLFPEYAGADGPYLMLRAIHEHLGDTTAAIGALRSHVDRRETDYDAHIALANALERTGALHGAADILERAMYINPYDPAVHDRMASLYSATGQHQKVVRERRAVLALDPVNRADALYRLAEALNDAGDAREARRQVLRALEIAPNFRAAQELLLRLEGAPR